MVSNEILDGYEKMALQAEHKELKGHGHLCQAITELVDEVRRLHHELDDPRYMYGSGRINRQAILCRNAEIESLRERLKSHG